MKFLRRDTRHADPRDGAVPRSEGRSRPALDGGDGRRAPQTRHEVSIQNSGFQQPGKDSAMARSPFALPQPVPPSSTAQAPAFGAHPIGARAQEAVERRTLVVGRGISLQGTVRDAERLVVEGTVEATTIAASELTIAQGGVFKGEVEVEKAEVAGTIDVTLIARHSLLVRGTGKVLGVAHCRRLQVEDGGQITGRVEMITEGADVALPEATNVVEPEKAAAD